MPNPAWVTSENVKFDSTLSNAAVLKTSGSTRTIVLWDRLSAGDQAILTDFIDKHGGALPLAGPTSGVQTVNFGKTVIGATATGLSNVAAATAAKSTVNIGGAAVGGQASGLSSAVGTQGVQVVNFSSPIAAGTSTGLVPTAAYQDITFTALAGGGDATNLLTDAAGYQIVNVGGAKTGGSATGLANDATVYTANITVDGVLKAIAITGSTAQTFTTLVNQINTDLGASATAAIVGGNIKITSATTGLASTVATVDVDLFATLTGFVAVVAAVAGTHPIYTTTITVDGVAKAISIVGSAAQTFTNLVSEINTDLGAAATAVLDVPNKRIRVTSATTTTSSTMLIVQGTLFAAPLANFSAITATVPGRGSLAALTATIQVDGVNKAISVLPASIGTFADLINEINTDLGASAVAAIVGQDIKVTSATFGSSSKVKITPGTLFPALPGYVGPIPAQNGVSQGRSYSATVTVDGVIKSVKFLGTAGDTIQHVIDEINTDLGAAATAALTGGNIVITSATTGLGSSVKIDDNGFLFNRLTGYVGITNTRAVAPTVYTATITVDGVDKAISIQGNTAQTFTTLVNEINTDLGASAVASIANNRLVITSATTGVTSTVSIRDGNLLKGLGATGVTAPVNGIADLVVAMKQIPVGSGNLYQYLNAFTVGAKPVKPSVPATLPKTPAFTYWTGGAWKYLEDDTNV